MQTTNGALHFEATLDYSQIKKGVAAIQSEIYGLNRTTEQSASSMDSQFKKLGLAIGSYFSAQALFGFTKELINVRGEFQKTEIAFSTMLGSQEKAQALMGDMVKLAASTPFSLQEVSAGAKQLLAFQVPANQVVDTLTRMGNIAAGLGVPLERINLVYGQVKAKGRLMGDDLRQFTEAGIPMIHELAKNFNVTDSAISKMVTDGKIGFSDVQKVLNNLTNEGGMFYNLMEKQSQSLSGKVSNLGDAWDQMLNKIGTENQSALAGGIDELSYLVSNYEKVIEVLKDLVIVYGTYRAAMILNSVAIQAAATSEVRLTAAQELRAGATVIANRATEALNNTIFANPYAAAMALVAGLGYALLKMATQASYAEEAQGNLNKKLNEAHQHVEEHKAKIESLVTAIKSENTTNERRGVLLNQIKTLANGRLDQLTVEAIRTGKATAAINQYIAALDRQAKAKAYVDLKAENYKRIAEIDTIGGKHTIGEAASAVFDANTYKNSKGKVTAGSIVSGLTQNFDDQIAKNRQLEKKALLDLNRNLDNLIKNSGNDIADAETAAGNKQVDSIKDTNKRVKKAREEHQQELQEVVSDVSIIALERRVENWNAALQRVHLDAKGNRVVDVLTQDKFGKQVKTGETISDVEALKRQQADNDRLEAEKKALRLKSFDEELAETERQWKAKYAIAQHYGKEVADAQFPQLKTSYYDDISKKAEEFSDKMKSGAALSDDEVQHWEKLQAILNSLTGEKDPLSNFNDSIDRSLAKLPSLSEQIQYLTNLRDSQDSTGVSKGFYAAADNKLQDKLKEQRDYYQTFLREKETFEQRKAEIDSKYDSLNSSISKSDQSQTEKNRLLKESATARGKEYSQAFLDSLKNTDMWQKAFGDIGRMTNKEISANIAALKIQVKQATANGATAEEIKILNDRIKELQDVLDENPFQKIADDFKKLGDETLTDAQKLAVATDLFNAAGEAVNMIGDAFGGMSDQTKQAVSDVMAIGNAALQVATSIASGNVAGMIVGVIKLVGAIAKALNGDAKKERQIKRQAAAVSELKMQYDALDKAVSKALGDDKYKSQENVIANLRQQSETLQKMVQTEQSKKKSDQTKINDYKSQIQTINQQIDEIQNNIVKNVLQTDAQDAAGKLGDALVNAFSKGEDASKAMRDTANSMIQDIVKNALKMRMEKALQPVMNNLLSQLGFNSDGTGSFKGLSPDQIEAFKTQIAAIGQQQQGFLDAYQQLFQGTDSSSAQGLKADIKGVTEKTAGALEAQINAMRINQVSGLEAMRASLLQLSQIEVNTRPIIQIQKDISELNTKFSKNGLKAIGIG